MRNESNVNRYGKIFPTVFRFAKGDILTDVNGKEYIDFFSGAGSMNYGHNHPVLKEALLHFLNEDRIVHCLDMDTTIKDEFLKKFESIILQPRGLNYMVQFTGPTGTNAVEAAIKLAKKITGRSSVISFTNSFHGMTSTSLALSGGKKASWKLISPQEVVVFPFDNFFGDHVDTMELLEKSINHTGSGVLTPAAIILETVQAEGGVNIARISWLKKLREFSAKNKILLIVDDIQVGCGRTGDFFSFERAEIIPDIVALSKSISGFGLPLSLLLIKPQFDIWEPGEHTGTFRSNNLALCAATSSLKFWIDDSMKESTLAKSNIIEAQLRNLKEKSDDVQCVRGLGMIWGVECKNSNIAKAVAEDMFSNGVLIERCGNDDQVLKILCPLTISLDNLNRGLAVMESSFLKLGVEESTATPAKFG